MNVLDIMKKCKKIFKIYYAYMKECKINDPIDEKRIY